MSFLNIVKVDGIQSPFKSKSFDKILTRYTIHNFPGHDFRTQFYKEYTRIIKDNGELILGMVLDLKNYIDPKLRHRLVKKHFMFWLLSIRKMKEELHDFGFKFVHIRKTLEPRIDKNIYYRFREAGRRFFLPVFLNNPITYNFVDLKFRKI